MAVRAGDMDLDRDRRLVEAWQAGDASAFDDLYRRYFDRLRQFCERRIGDRSEAEELAQEAFVRALQALPRLDGERRFYPWMTVIASRLCIDHHRRRARVQPSELVDAGAVDDGHDARHTLQVDLEHLDRALDRIGPRHAEVLDLRERRGLTYNEIAGELGVPHSTVEALLFRARRALRREFRLVSADRLAAVPGLGWVLARLARLRDRLAVSGVDLGSLGTPLAAGAVTAMMVVLPFGGPAAGKPVTTFVGRPHPAVASPAPTPTAPAPPPAAPSVSNGHPPASAVAPTFHRMSGGRAAKESATMPVHLDLAHTGAGVDPTPVLDKLTAARNERNLP